MIKELNLPIADEEIRKLEIGDSVSLTGVMITGRDAAHKWIVEQFIHPTKPVSAEDQTVYKAIRPILEGGIIYHCGPVVAGLDTQKYRFVAAGPTTSIREEIYQGEVMRHFNLKGVIGKGGMGSKTLKACQEVPAVYFHAIGGAASLIAESVVKVVAVHKLEFGVPEALWVIEVRNFPVVVTMDAHGRSLHEIVRNTSKKKYERLIA
jgi:fumarate hydratase subunit beta